MWTEVSSSAPHFLPINVVVNLPHHIQGYPSGIADPCGTVAGMVTPKGSMSTEGETLQVSVLPYRCSIFVDF